MTRRPAPRHELAPHSAKHPAPRAVTPRPGLGLFALGWLAAGLTAGCGTDLVTPSQSLVGDTVSASATHLQTDSGFRALVSGPASVRKVIGNNDLVPVDQNGNNVPPQFRGLLDAFGRISVSCTATHIGHGIVLTAGHCFRATSMREGNLSCDHIKVEWGARKGVAPYLVSTCEVILAQETSDSRDYAIFKVDEAPRATARISAQASSVGRAITVFGHPQQRPLEWSGLCEWLGGAQGGFEDADFAHQCDTEVGNSGSTVLDAQTGDVVGIHDGGVTPYNYGTAIQSTPLAEFERYYSGRESVPPLGDEDDALSFGKLDLGNDQKDKLLVELTKPGKATVNFKLTVNLEGQVDSVVLEDSQGRRSSRITGKETFDMTGMKAPVKVLFSSDGTGLSTLVKISRVVYQ